MKLISQNPATEEIIEEYAVHSPKEISKSLETLNASFEKWRKSSLPERTQLLIAVSKILRRDRERLASLINLEMGKLPTEALAEIDKCAACADYYSEHGRRLLADLAVSTEARKSYVTYQPLGVVFAIMPWNFPFWQVFRCALPALLLGNTVVLKHASNVSGCALAIEKIFQEAACSISLFRTILTSGAAALDVIRASEVSAVSFTGSTQVGRSIAETCGQVLKKSVLELGGSDAYLVLKDADIALAAKACATSRLLNAGQSCIAAKRFIVAQEIEEEFMSAFVTEASKSQIAPLAKNYLRADLHAQVMKSLQQGARLIQGGKIPQGRGFYYPTTILRDVKPGMTCFEEESFGPVAALISAASEPEAIALANCTPFALGAALFSRDLERAEKIAKQELIAGSVFVNAFVRSDPRLPFGGTKESGWGRELSHFGLYEFANIKTVYLL